MPHDRPLLGIGATLLGADPDGRLLFRGKPLQVFEQELSSALRLAGAELIFFPLIDSAQRARRLIGLVDGLVLAGGPDIHPSAYGASGDAVKTEPERDRSELLLTEAALARELPILGVCRGAQLLNVAFGGTLIRHLDGHRDAEIYDRLGHEIRLAPDSTLRQWYGSDRISVTSVHHQAVDRLGDGLAAVGWAEDGTIEAVELPGSLVLGVQWHPEWLTHREAEAPDPVFVRFCEAAAR